MLLYFFYYSFFIYLKTCFHLFILNYYFELIYFFNIYIFCLCNPLLYKDKYIPLIPCIPYGDTDIPTVW